MPAPVARPFRQAVTIVSILPALANNPSVAEAAALVEAAQGKWVQVGLPRNPRLGCSGQQLGSGGQAEQQGLFMEQEVIRGGKLQLNRAVAGREIGHA